ncbi:hypothetical protein CLPUN_30720 [Clostridium puniceum]|uniref:Uncharacterized protein n=1 Tax=Clostridium puniceum TaxID=29367 RepID=A0A1S8TD23_9CLOT|nr:hypothetical protein [Clostridium puniceum]OOM75717.1 hypothetical protein CLPUN_30720 [Clostridium puniceum]
MSSYRSAYENYYKNINKVAKGTNNKYLTKDKKVDNSISSKYGINLRSKDTIIETLIKRVIIELTGATILLLFFTGLKYIPVAQINELHIRCKQTLEQDFNYNGAIDAFNGMYIGNIQGKDLRIGNFTADDLKIENLKLKAVNFMQYIRDNSNSN